jgi:hypothetical protein
MPDLQKPPRALTFIWHLLSMPYAPLHTPYHPSITTYLVWGVEIGSAHGCTPEIKPGYNKHTLHILVYTSDCAANSIAFIAVQQLITSVTSEEGLVSGMGAS